MRDEKKDSAEAQIIHESNSNDKLSEPLRVRVTDHTLVNLDRVEAFFQGLGYRGVKRSHLVRVAVERLIHDITTEHPEIKEIVLRSHP